ncbi:MAG: hypothetical protein QXH53_05360 [Nitrososphaerales archaeon]
MKKVMIITHLAYAAPRITSLAKYFLKYDWQPIVVTPPLKNVTGLHLIDDEFLKKIRVIQVPYSDTINNLKQILGFNTQEGVRRQIEERFGTYSTKTLLLKSFIRFYKEIFYYPDQHRAWKSRAIKVSSGILKNEYVNAMISSSPPVISHLIAKELKIRYKIPWVADLQDLWSQNHNYPYSSLRNVIDRKLEVKTLSSADALVTVSQPLAKKLKMLHKNKDVYTITLGFDTEEMNETLITPTSKFTITYTGQIYRGKQDPSKLFAALRELISEGIINPNDVVIRFYGYKEPWLAEEIKKYGLSNIVRQYGLIPRKVALKKQRESQLLLILNWEDPLEKGVYTSKIFEYLAARRPIIATGGFGNDVVEILLNETNAGFYASKIEDIKRILKETYLEFKLNNNVSYHPREEVINKYTYQNIAKSFVQILNNVSRY